METIFGEGTQDNEVVIDYVRKTVEFRPVIEYSAINQQSILFGFTAITMFVRVFIPVYIILLLAPLVMPQAFVDVMMNISLVLTVALPFAFSFMYWHKEWRKKWYPEVNFTLFKLMWQAKHVTVTPSRMKNTMFVIRHFGNIGLDYVVKGDFARYLERVEVKCILKTEDGNDWSATFFFKNVPKSGSMRLTYV